MGWMMTGAAWSVLVWVLIGLMMLATAVLAGVWLVRNLREGGAGRMHSRSPEPPPGEVEILRHRYAAGEIDDEEYQRRLHTLRGP